MITHKKRLGILVAGGPAPGINSVIASATIHALTHGTEVIGILDGFKYIMRGDISQTRELTIGRVSRIHFHGGSYIGIARDNPTKDPKDLQTTVNSLLRLNIDKLITIGGDDTAFSAMKLEEEANGRIRVVHVPKTIDNDLYLPLGIPTFGFQTACNTGVDVIKNLMTDARTTSRWFFVIAMGRKAGHLAMSLGKAAGPTLTLIPEEFTGKNSITLPKLVDILVGSIIKRLSYGFQDGVAVLAEGLLEGMPKSDLKDLAKVERDEHDNIRFDEIDFGNILKQEVQKRLASFGIKTTIVAKNLGYELRCADPIAFDMEYTRDLGFNSAQHILEGGNGVMASIQNEKFVPMKLKDILDPKTGRTRIRLVNIKSEGYNILRHYMIRLSLDDFEDPHELAKYAATANISVQNFHDMFRYLVENDPYYQKPAASRPEKEIDKVDTTKEE
ncbi:6-phosphofructokinase [bacterium]|nr:6-phosphofructokinase [bacterium]